jgi:hypothetical protein
VTGIEPLAVVLLGLQGLAAIELLAGVRTLGTGRSLAAALPIGLVAQAVLALPLRLGGVAPTLASAAAQAGLLGAAALLAARFRSPAPPAAKTSSRYSAVEAAAAALIVAVLLLVLATAALEPPAEWDVLAIWGFKAKLLGGDDWLDRLRDPALAYAHPDYPLAWPFALASEPAFAPGAAAGGGSLLGAAMLAAAAGAAAALVRPRGRRAALAAAAVVATLPLAGAQAVRALADLPLATLLLVAAGLLAGRRAGGDSRPLALGAAAAAGLPLVKQEGLALAVAVAIVALLRAGRGARRHLATALGAAFLVVDLPWLVLRSTLPPGAANSFADMSLARVGAGLSRLPEIVAALPVYLGAPEDWGALWPLVALALVALALDRRRPRLETDLALTLLAPAPLYLVALLAVGWEPARLAEVTLSRLALHFAPLGAAFAVAVAARLGAFGRDPSAASDRVPAAGSGEEDRRLGG